MGLDDEWGDINPADDEEHRENVVIFTECFTASERGPPPSPIVRALSASFGHGCWLSCSSASGLVASLLGLGAGSLAGGRVVWPVGGRAGRLPAGLPAGGWLAARLPAWLRGPRGALPYEGPALRVRAS